MGFVTQLFISVFKPFIKYILFLWYALKLCLESDLDCLLQCLINLLGVENLLFKPLDLICLSLACRFFMHLSRWFCIPVYESCLKLSLLLFQSRYLSFFILNSISCILDLLISLFDLLCEGLDTLLVFPFKFVVLSLVLFLFHAKTLTYSSTRVFTTLLLNKAW